MNDPQSTVANEPTSTSTSQRIGRRQSDRIVAASEGSQRSLDRATACARTGGPVLILGPTGSGRRHFARAIHAWSARATGPFVVLPVATSPEALHERDLFGSGDSVTSLSDSSEGALNRAAQGSLLIAGIENLASSVLNTLIRAMQAGGYRRPGQSEMIPVTARILATGDIADEKIFGDIPVQIVRLGGLCERREDILPLAAHFLAEFAEEVGLRPVGFTSDARHWLVEDEWPGNVRELRERIRQAVRLSRDGVISAEALMLSNDGDDVPSFKEAKRAFETRYVEGLLRRCGGNISRAARLAKKDRKDFYDVIRRTGVDPGEFRS